MTDVEKYIAGFESERQEILNKIRDIIIEVAPGSEEKMAYGMPGYKTLGKPLVYFACHKMHVGFYALPDTNELFDEELKAYKRGKGSIQFQLDEPIPYELIRRIVIFRVNENLKKSKLLKSKTKRTS